MKIVKAKSSLLLFLIFFSSCKYSIQEEKNIEKGKSAIKNSFLKKYNYNNIQTNSLKDDFIGELIDTLSVKKKDTVLFRKWKVRSYKPIFLVNNESKFKIQNSEFISYYKTGKTKFSKYELSLKNTVTKKTFNFSTYINYGDERNPYDNNKTSSFVELEKITDTLGRFKVLDGSALGNFIYFKIKDDDIIITRLEIIPRTQIKQYSFIVDTLITISHKNNVIDIGKLNTITVNEKNIKK